MNECIVKRIGNNILAISVPEAAQDFKVDNGMEYLIWRELKPQKRMSIEKSMEMAFDNPNHPMFKEDPLVRGGKKIPTGNWEIVGQSNEITEGQMERIVEKEWDGTAHWYKNYTIKQGGFFKQDIKSSYSSWLQANEIASGYWLILIQE